MPCQESIADAKASFMTAVSEGINTLMQQCGYSRDRATSALMRELNRGESTRPSDEEIFAAMKRYHLGIEEATKTIVISRAVKRTMATASPANAIEILVSKISLRNLTHESSDENPTSEDELTIRPDFRVEPVSRMDKHLMSRRKQTFSRKPKAVAKNPRLRTKPPTKNTAGRKRPIDEIASTEKDSNFQKRERLDSVSAEIDAKIAKQSNEEGVGNEALMRSPPGVRAKRAHRTEETESLSQTSSHKRIRGSEG